MALDGTFINIESYGYKLVLGEGNKENLQDVDGNLLLDKFYDNISHIETYKDLGYVEVRERGRSNIFVKGKGLLFKDWVQDIYKIETLRTFRLLKVFINGHYNLININGEKIFKNGFKNDFQFDTNDKKYLIIDFIGKNNGERYEIQDNGNIIKLSFWDRLMINFGFKRG